MKRRLLLMAVLTAVAGCGASDDGAADRFVRVTYGAPVELSELAQQQQNLALTMTKILEGEEAETEVGSVLEYDEGDAYYATTVKALPPGRYVTRVYISYPNEGLAATLSGVEKTQYESTGGVPISVHEVTIDVVVGQEEIILDVAPADFSLNLDADGDGRNNLTEIVEGTNPYVPETEDEGERAEAS